MPAVPKITDISREKWSIKVFGGVNAEEIADSDSESAVSREIEKQIKTIGIHVAEQRTDAIAARGQLEPVSFDQRSEYELVEQSAKKVVHGIVEISQKLSAATLFFPVGNETAITIDRAGGNRRKE